MNTKTKQDYYYWRLLATAISFFNFGLGGLILRFVFVPFLWTIPMSAARRQHIGRFWMRSVLRFFVWQMKFLGVLSYDIQGLEKIKPGQLLIANHPSLIDVVFLISFIKQANCVVRKGLFTNPFTAGALKGAGYIPNTDGEQLLNACVQSLAQQDTLIIFPEGTRTVPQQKPRFLRGAANIALYSGADVIPVTIKCSESTLTKGEKWYHIPNRRPHWTFIVGDVLLLPDLEASPKAARRLTQLFLDYFFTGDDDVISQ